MEIQSMFNIEKKNLSVYDIKDGAKRIYQTAHFHRNLSQWQTIKTFSWSPKDCKENVKILLITAFCTIIHIFTEEAVP